MPRIGTDRSLAGAAGWVALAAAVAAASAVVPPLVMPETRQPPSRALPSPSPVASRTPVPVPSRAAPTRSPSGNALPTTQVHAADPANIRQGARIIECAPCEGGRRVGYIGGPNILAIAISGVRSAGTRTLTITYETEQPRTLMLSVDGGPVRELSLAGAGSWLIPATVSVPVFIPEGTSWIKFFNTAGSAPDINQIAVS